MASPVNTHAIEAALAKPNYVPPGITLQFMEQNRDQPAIIAILFVGTLATIFVALRCYARLVIVRGFGPDDWLALLTLIPYTIFISLCIVLIHLGSGRHFLYIQYILDNATINKTEVLDFTAHIVYTTALLVCRMSGLAFYARISDKHDTLTWTIRGAAAFIGAGYLVQVFLIIFHCLPVTGLWPYSFQPEVSNYTCLEWGTVYVTNSAISVVSDLILFTIPAAIIGMLRVSLSRKIKLSLILMPGLLVIGISSVRMYLVVIGQWETDESWSYDPFLAVEVSEIGSTIIALSIPALKPFFGNLFTSLDRTSASSPSYTRSKSGTRRSHRQGDSGIIELSHRDGSGDSQTAIRGASRQLDYEDEDWEKQSGWQNSASAVHVHGGGDQTVRGDVSQHQAIRRQVEYSVSREDANSK